MMEKPDVDSIEGLSPAISIEQKSTSHNPRSTVATVTEIYDYLRLLYARAGIPRCPDHGLELAAQTVSQMVDQVLELGDGTPLLLLAPVVKDRKGEHAQVLDELKGKGFVRGASTAGSPSSTTRRARPQAQAHHRGGRRPLQGARRHRPAARRVVRDRAQARQRHRGVAFIDEPQRAGLVFSDKFACNVCGCRSPSSSRGCSPSTTRRAPAPTATAWASSSSSTRHAS